MQFSRRCQAANPNGALSGNWTQQQVVHGDGKQWVAESSGAKRGWARSATSSGAKCYSIFAGLHASEDFRPKPSQEANLHQTNGLMATLDLNRRRESNRMKQQTVIKGVSGAWTSQPGARIPRISHSRSRLPRNYGASRYAATSWK